MCASACEITRQDAGADRARARRAYRFFRARDRARGRAARAARLTTSFIFALRPHTHVALSRHSTPGRLPFRRHASRVHQPREPSQPGTTHAPPPSSIDVKRAILIRGADALHEPRPQIGRPPLLPQLELPPPSTAVGADCAHHLRGALGPGVELELGAGAGAEVRDGVGLGLVWGLG